jgi:hypothetical protein
LVIISPGWKLAGHKASPSKPVRDLTGSLVIFNCRQW